MKNYTIKDVAKHAGVSTGTVSAVINGKATVKASTRERVLAVMKELNFRPKGQARNLKGQYMDRSIGLIIRDLENPFYTALAMGVKRYANSKGYIEFLASSEYNHENEEEFTQLFAAKDVKGVIIAPVINGTIEIEHLFRLKMLNYPFVMLEEVQGIKANVVSINNQRATMNAVKYLISTGHTDIIHFSGPEFASHAFERINGFRNAFSESHLIFRDDLIVSCGSHFQNGYDTGMRYFKEIDEQRFPMAVVCYNDMTALGLLSALQRLKIDVPGQVSVIGNDDIEFARHWTPALTTIHTPLEELGRKAAEVLIRNIEADQVLPIEDHVLES
ncbi:MAG: LacI family DNA-binding transcriptional regulator, partial [Fidelibacterota bacterium]